MKVNNIQAASGYDPQGWRWLIGTLLFLSPFIIFALTA